MQGDTMTTPAATEQFTDLARRGQEAATAAVESWVDALRHYADAITPRGSRPVDPQVAVSATFTLAERLLHAQRELVGTAVALVTEAGESATAQASIAGETLKAHAEEATERVVDLAAENGRRTATAGRNGVSV
jgi:hypothetical protein